jgi:transcriptional antiterminator NusG
MSKQDPEEQRLEEEPVEPAEELVDASDGSALKDSETAEPDQSSMPAESSDQPGSNDAEQMESGETPVAEEPARDSGDAEVGAEESIPTPVIDEPMQEPSLDESEPSGLEGLPISVEDDSGAAWFVVHCYSGYENKVRHNLEQRIETMGMKDMIFDVVVPTQEEIEVRDGKRRTVERHIFPGYVLVNMVLTEESWYVVRNTPGVTGFVGMGNNPTPLRPEEVVQIVKRMEADAPTVKVTFKVGERVRIIDGPFNDFRGMVSEIDMERTKVRVMVSFFGRETPVELDFLQVEKA